MRPALFGVPHHGLKLGYADLYPARRRLVFAAAVSGQIEAEHLQRPGGRGFGKQLNGRIGFVGQIAVDGNDRPIARRSPHKGGDSAQIELFCLHKAPSSDKTGRGRFPAHDRRRKIRKPVPHCQKGIAARVVLHGSQPSRGKLANGNSALAELRRAACGLETVLAYSLAPVFLDFMGFLASALKCCPSI